MSFVERGQRSWGRVGPHRLFTFVVGLGATLHSKMRVNVALVKPHTPGTPRLIVPVSVRDAPSDSHVIYLSQVDSGPRQTVRNRALP